MSKEMILHPRPNTIVAALYTLRDLDADVAVMHGPTGCSFKHSRLLEEDGMHVVTSAMNESNFVFGGHDSLVRVLREAEEMFQPELMGVVGTCSSMIIGEDLQQAVEDSGVGCKVVAVNVHAGYRDNTIGVNLNGAFYWCSLVVQDMKEAGFGRIVNIASVAARGGGVIGPHYAASKAGMLGLTRYAARELGPFGITVNAIAPAFIEDAGPFLEWDQEKIDRLKEKVMVSRLGNVDDVIRAFDYLLDSSFVTGVTLDVNGGTFMI